MKFHQFLAFSTDIPDDTVEEDEEIVRFGGEAVAYVMAQVLRDAGYVVGELDNQMERGWSFEAKLNGQSIWPLLQHFGDFLMLQIDERAHISSDQQKFKESSLKVLVHGLERDGRFHDLLWIDEMGQPYGFTEPVVDAPGSERRKTPAAWN